MEILVVLLRLLHIVAAAVWVGLGIAMVWYIAPAANSAGESGLRFLKALLTRTGFSKAFPAAAGLTVLAGILLYLTGSAGRFTQVGNMVLGTGALFGVLAMLHGGAATGRATTALLEALNQHVQENQPVPAEALSTLRERAAKLATHSRISAILMIIALVGMGSARYL